MTGRASLRPPLGTASNVLGSLPPAVKPSTQKAYRNAYERYVVFCTGAGIQENNDGSLLQFLAAAFSGELRLAGTSHHDVPRPLHPTFIDHWAGGVRAARALQNLPDPFVEGHMAQVIREVRHGYSRAARRLLPPARGPVPLTPEMLRRFFDSLRVTSYRDHRRLTVTHLAASEGMTPAEIAALPPTAWLARADEGRLTLGPGRVLRIPCTGGQFGCLHCSLDALSEGCVSPLSLFGCGQKWGAPIAEVALPAATVAWDLQRIGGSWADVTLDKERLLLGRAAPPVHVLWWQAGELLRGVRDYTMVLVGFHLGLRAADLRRLRRPGIVRVPNGYHVTVPPANGRGAPVTFDLIPTRDSRLDPVLMMDLWLDARDHAANATVDASEDQPIFCRFGDMQRLLVGEDLADPDVYAALKRLEHLSGQELGLTCQSMRKGFAELAFDQAASEEGVQLQLRLKKFQSLRRYRRSERGGTASTRLRGA